MQLSGGYVFILLQNARPSKKPDPYAQLSLGKQQEVTNVQMRTYDPVWEQGFTFLVNNPESDSLFIKVGVVFDVISLDRYVKHLYQENGQNLISLALIRYLIKRLHGKLAVWSTNFSPFLTSQTYKWTVSRFVLQNLDQTVRSIFLCD